MLFLGLAALSLAASSPVDAQESPAAPNVPAASSRTAEPPFRPLADTSEKLSVTRHSVRIGGTEVRYTATAGTLLLKEETGKPRASLFFVAYTRDGVSDLTRRPVTFTFNGGPGSSSVWLHLGTFGPRRVRMDDEGKALPPPGGLVDNAESLLDVTDLVFIDPVSTGYSRALPGEDPQRFHGVREDVESVGELIRIWTTRFNRWTSPKFLAGESYGTTRAAALAQYLQERHGLYLNGLLLISSILNFQTADFNVGNDLPSMLYLPTYTATAWYHKRLPAELQGDLRTALAEAERFALGDYSLALVKGNRLTPEERRDIAGRLSRLTGLSPDYLLRVNLRPQIGAFVKELLRDQRKTVGRLDSRFEGLDRDAAGDEFEYDPSYAAIQGPFTAALNDYVRRDLQYESELAYEILTDRVDPWSFGDFVNRYVNVAEDLRQAMVRNPSLRVFVGSGYYDLATPYFATEYTFDHLAFDPGYEQRVTKAYYEAGHMMYIRKADREKLKADLAAFLRAASGG
ncbi:MAG TPA: peptidase S10 [Thermoanaerobaculia bacterium]|nr:peptidase S10 [Thermoanaerobaculia bacterium]